jgi:hypothetical protein
VAASGGARSCQSEGNMCSTIGNSDNDEILYGLITSRATLGCPFCLVDDKTKQDIISS